MNVISTLLRAGLTLGLAAALASCGGDEHDHGHDHGDGHVHAAQFGGDVIELGDHFANIEVVLDGEAGSLTIYSMDGHNENTVKSSTEELRVTIEPHEGDPYELVLAAEESELTGNEKGASSKFSVTDERLKGLDHLHGSLASIEVKGTTFEDVDLAGGHDHDGGDGDDHDHDHDDHDHDHEGEDTNG